MTGPDHLAHLQADAAVIADLLLTADPDAPVPACSQWALRDLVLHLGQIHRWATDVVRTGERQRPPEVDVPDGGLADWLSDGADALHRTLRDTDPERPCWTLAGPGTARFWCRRQALETVVHRVDVEQAVGRQGGVPDDLAEDGVAEVVETLHPRQVALERTPPPRTGVTLVSTTGRTWDLGTMPAAATLTGRPGDLLLLLWRRVPRTAPALTAGGDLTALDDLLAGSLTP